MTFVKDFRYTLRIPSTDYFKSIASHTKMRISQELVFYCVGNCQYVKSRSIFLPKAIVIHFWKP